MNLRLGHPFRSLHRSPAYVAVTVPMLALSLGVATAVFAIVNTVLHPALPFQDAEQLFSVTSRGDGANRLVAPIERLTALGTGSAAVAHVALTEYEQSVVEFGSRVEQYPAKFVSSNYFPIMGVSPVRGRLFSPASERADAGTSVVVSFRVWRELLGSPLELDGIAVTVNGASHHVVGVAPPGMSAIDPAALWRVMGSDAVAFGTGLRWPRAVVRVRPGVTLSALQRDLHGVAEGLTRRFGTGAVAFYFAPRPLRPDPLELQEIHFALIAAAVALVLIGCANLAHLVMARGFGKQRDVALRLAVGASRRDVLAETLAECLLLSLAGGAVGLLLAAWALGLVQHIMPPGIPFVGDLAASLDWRVFLFTVAAAIATALVFGVGPALRISRIDVSTPLKEGAAGVVAPARGRYSVLVSAELALALAVLVGAGLLVRASLRMRTIDVGIDYRSITTAHVSTRYSDTTSEQHRRAFFEGLERGARRLPGVETVAWRAGSTIPAVTSALDGGGNVELQRPTVWTVSADYLPTMGIDVIAGRGFMAGDEFAQGVAIVDDSAAKVLWGVDDPLGQQISIGALREATAWIPVVGVARHVRFYGASLDYFAGAGAPSIYLVQPTAPTSRELVVRSRSQDVTAVTFALRRFLRDAVPVGASYRVEPLQSSYDDVLSAQAFLANIFLALGLLALAISAFGVYSVLSYSVAQRRRDFAVRLALGATPGSITRSVVHDAAVMVLAGTGAGAFVAMWSSQFVDAFLFDLYRIDAPSLVAAEFVLVAVALAGAAIPAWRAARSDPMEVIRAS